MDATSIIKRAGELVSGEREVTHGDKFKNFQNICDLWNAYLRLRRDPSAPLTPLDYADMMELQKIARGQSGCVNEDDYVDRAGYAGCAGEIATSHIIPKGGDK
jgi:hypothetical protein